MSPTDLAAYIGAAAWLPQIAKLIYVSVATPHLSVSPAPTIEMCYSENGPTIRLVFSISAERRDAVVDLIELRVRHEQGEERTLRWITFGDSAAESSGPVTAVKITTTSLVDLRVVFQDIRFAAQMHTLRNDVISHFQFLCKTSNDPSSLDAILKTKPAHDARDHFNGGWYWKAGKYTFQVSLRTKGRTHTDNFRVVLSKADAESLHGNCTRFDDHLTATVLESTGQPAAPTRWIWVSVPIDRAQDND